MLNLNPEVICTIIYKAAEFHAKEAMVLPENAPEPSDDWYFQVLADFKDDLTFQELKAAINDLEPDQQATLVALMWLGRGDFDKEEWEEAYKEAMRNWNQRTADYLMLTPLVADYLKEGLNLLGYSCD
jgi:hypothetical protein